MHHPGFGPWRARRAAVVALALVALLAGCGTSASTTGGTTTNATAQAGGGGCTPGTPVVNGISTRQFCGPAKAQATVAGQAETWSGGQCFDEAGMAGVNIGRIILDPTNSAAAQALKKQYDYFGAEATATADGSYQGFATGVYHGTDISASGTVTFTDHLQAGSFSGNLITGGAMTASWAC